MKKKPQTIADLKINWAFDYDCIKHESAYVKKFNRNNPNLKKVRIKPGVYFFVYNDITFELLLSPEWKWGLGQFLWVLNYQLRVNSYFYIEEKKCYGRTIDSFELKKFELLSENTFKIHEK